MVAGMELVIFVGLQAAGKSTFFARRFAGTHVLVSKDAMPNNRRPGRRQLQLVREALTDGRSVVVDNTNPALADRDELIALGHELGARVVAYMFASTAGESLRRNQLRTGRARVPDVAIFATRKRLVAPTYAEGFDAIYRARIANDGDFDVELMPTEERPAASPLAPAQPTRP